MDHSIDYCPYVGEWEQLNADVIALKAQLAVAQAREVRLREHADRLATTGRALLAALDWPHSPREQAAECSALGDAVATYDRAALAAEGAGAEQP